MTSTRLLSQLYTCEAEEGGEIATVSERHRRRGGVWGGGGTGGKGVVGEAARGERRRAIACMLPRSSAEKYMPRARRKRREYCGGAVGREGFGPFGGV